MAVIVEEVHTDVVDTGAAPAAPREPRPLDEAELQARFGPLLRQLIREEIERYLRSAAD